MRYKYPKINNWLVFERTSSGEYTVTDFLNDEVYTFGSGIYRFAKRLDGHTNPFSISKYWSSRDVTAFLRELDKHDLIRRSRVLHSSAGKLYYTLWTPRYRNGRNFFPKIINMLLQILFLPVFILGCVSFYTVMPDFNGQAVTINIIIGVLIGIMLHEMAHAIAGLAYGGKVFEIGLMLKLPFPGAYVLMDSSSVKGAIKRAQVDAAGIEANIFLAGISFLLAAFLHWNTRGFFCIAFANAELALINLLLVDGLDGAGIMSNLLGIDSLGKVVRHYCLNLRKQLPRHRGNCPDAVFSTVCFSFAMVQPAYAVLFVLNVWVFISWIV